jgi:hypothetical protein
VTDYRTQKIYDSNAHKELFVGRSWSIENFRCPVTALPGAVRLGNQALVERFEALRKGRGHLQPAALEAVFQIGDFVSRP